MELSGVRNSCDMFARNSDLYFDVSANSADFFLQRMTGLFHFRVLTLDLGVLLREQPGLGAQFVVGLLEFALTGLEFDGELLGLGQQAFRAHRRFDGIEDRADTLCQ